MSNTHEVRPGQSIELLKALHILTRDGKMNQDSRRKLKQVYHLYQFIEPLLQSARDARGAVTLVDHGAGKSYLGFILYDLFFKDRRDASHIYGIETRAELVQSATELAARLGFGGMSFLNLSVADSIASEQLPPRVDIVTALHACNTATDDAIRFALAKQAQSIVLVPCCQAEVAAVLRKNKARALADPMAELWRHPLHTREQPAHQCAALPAARGPWLPAQRDRAGRLGTLDEERTDHRPPPTRQAAPRARAPPARNAGTHRPAGAERALPGPRATLIRQPRRRANPRAWE
ncbi:methyltransferase domain protein [Bordetella bronchiseptica MO275]|nr:methyltransferase domain protein [Bordetella bronchiseptica MO275]